jgi:dTDP-4-dehydrorhamnose 3,5-epimerase
VTVSGLAIEETPLRDLVLVTPTVYPDDRGFFLESYNAAAFAIVAGLNVAFVQDNHSRSSKGVLRGLHYQLHPMAQGKLVRIVRGSVLDVAVDIRKSSPTFGEWFAVELTEDNHKQLWVPPGFAHGFLTLSDHADLLYKVTEGYSPEHDRGIRWDDPDIGIDWPDVGVDPILSQKDAEAPFLRTAETFE